jgi:integrase
MRRHAPDGTDQPMTAYVFGNEVGERAVSVSSAWRRVCGRAGITDLHFHDLRREFACRLLESSADLHDVRDFLGHANISTTSRYLQSNADRLARALARMDSSRSTGGSAQDSHNAPTAPAAEPQIEDSDNRSNLLN